MIGNSALNWYSIWHVGDTSRSCIQGVSVSIFRYVEFMWSYPSYLPSSLGPVNVEPIFSLTDIIFIEFWNAASSAVGLTPINSAVFHSFCLFTPPGSLFDSTQSYDATFYIAGSLFLAAGIISLPLHRIKRWEQQSSGQGVRDPVMPNGHVWAQTSGLHFLQVV